MPGPPATPPTPLTALRLALALSAPAACTPQFAHADIFRWDNGQLIPGTAGITPAPGANLSSMSLGYANLVSATLQSADLTATDLDHARLTSANLTSAVLATGYLVSAILASANLTSASLTSSNLTSSNLTSAILLSSNLTSTNFTDADIRWVDFGLIEPATGFTEAQFDSTASYKNHDLTGITLRRAVGWNFSGQLLTSAVVFDMRSANLSSANLTSANFRSALLHGADLANAILRGANFSEIIDVTPAQLYSTASYQARDLAGLRMRYDHLVGWDFSNQDLTSASFNDAELTSASFNSANLQSADLGGTPENQTPAQLGFADFTLADLRGVSGFTSMASTILRGTILPDGSVNAFTLNSTETFHIRAGSIVTLNGPITISTNSTISIDSGASVTSATALALPSAASLQVSGILNAPITLNGGTLSGYGTISNAVTAGTAPHTIAPSFGLPPTSAGALTLASLSTNNNTTLAFNLLTPGPASINDQLIITAPAGLSLNGGNIQIANTSTGKNSLGYYKIIQYTGSIQGTGISSLTLPAESNNIAYIIDTTHDPGYIDIHRGFLGDANDDGIVNAIDLGILATNYNSTTADWSQGDYNNDGIVNAIDLGILATNYNAVVGSGSFDSDVASYPVLVSAAASLPYDVPEPATLARSSAGMAALILRKPRGRSEK